MGQDLESREEVPTPPSPNSAWDFAHHNGHEVLHDPGAKWHNAQAVLVVNGKQSASPYPVRVCSNTGHWLSYKLAHNGQAQVHFCWRTWCARLSELRDIWAHHSAFCHNSSASNERTHDPSTITMQSRNTLPSFFQRCRWDVARRKCMAPWSSLSMCGIHFAQTSHFPRLFVRIRQTLAEDILTSIAISKHEVLHACSRTDFTCSTWHSSVADVGAPLQGALSVSLPLLMEFTHWQTVSCEVASVPKPTFNDV